MANISMLLNRTIKWNPDKYEFPGDEEANALTQRPQREAYRIVL